MATHWWSMLDPFDETMVHGDTVVVHVRLVQIRAKRFMATLRWSMLDLYNLSTSHPAEWVRLECIKQPLVPFR